MSMRTTQCVARYSPNRWDTPRASACSNGNKKKPDVTMRNETAHRPTPRITLQRSNPLEQSLAPARGSLACILLFMYIQVHAYHDVSVL